MQSSEALSFTELVLNASFLVQCVMLFLIALSVVSWTIIFSRVNQYRVGRSKADEFEERFWSGIDLNNLYQDCMKRTDDLVGLEVIYTAGFKEFVRLVNSGPADQEVVMDGTYRQMKVACSREVELLENHLPTLATIGSISPYVGLFGTVWGIMHAFVSLAAVKNATLAMVAPPIAEALIATAMGLFAAIPAVMFYNRFVTKVEALENRYYNFMDEFSTILNRRLVTIRTQLSRQNMQNNGISGSMSQISSGSNSGATMNNDMSGSMSSSMNGSMSGSMNSGMDGGFNQMSMQVQASSPSQVTSNSHYGEELSNNTNSSRVNDDSMHQSSNIDRGSHPPSEEEIKAMQAMRQSEMRQADMRQNDLRQGEQRQAQGQNTNPNNANNRMNNMAGQARELANKFNRSRNMNVANNSSNPGNNTNNSGANLNNNANLTANMSANPNQNVNVQMNDPRMAMSYRGVVPPRNNQVMMNSNNINMGAANSGQANNVMSNNANQNKQAQAQNQNQSSGPVYKAGVDFDRRNANNKANNDSPQYITPGSGWQNQRRTNGVNDKGGRS